MTVSRNFRLPLRSAALALCSVAIVALATPASARPHHGASRHYHAHHSKHHAKKHHGHRYRHHARRGRSAAAVAAVETPTSQGFGGFGGSNIVAEARRYIGSGNPTNRSSLWCARFMNMVLEKSGHKGTGSDMARSFAGYGQRISGPQVGAIAVMSRGRRGGHVGVVSGIDAKGNPIVISGNHGRRVAEASYSRGRIYAYVMPSS
ncbi:MAG: TIGR02594 family protein [Pseudomonadota bacterium]